MPRPTLIDVARAAGVSRSSVSYAYNRPSRVSPELRERVFAAAAELGYAGPDPAASTLRRGRAGALGVLFTEALSYAFADPAAVLFLRGIAAVGERADVALTLLPVPPRPGSTDSRGAPDDRSIHAEGARSTDSRGAPDDRSIPPEGAMAAVRGSVIDGAIVYSLPEEHPAVRALVARRLPLMRVDMDATPDEAVVRIDDRGGARAVAGHVLGRGHRAVGVLVDRLSADGFRGHADPARRRAATFPTARLRLAGYADALAAAGVDPDAVPLFDCAGNLVEDGRAGAHALLEADPALTAIVAMTDQLARGALRAAADRGLRVPADLAVTGFDDLPEAAAEGLTTVHQDHAAKGALAAELLLGADEPGEHLLPTRLVVRETA